MAATAILDFRDVSLATFRYDGCLFLELCAKFGSNVLYSRWERPTLFCSWRSTDGVMPINFRFRLWSCGHLRVVVLHLYTKLRENIFIQCRCIIMLRNSIWPPSAILDFFGEVVGPPTKAYSWWLSLVKFCSDRLRRVQVISIWIFVLYSWKSYSWAHKFF